MQKQQYFAVAFCDMSENFTPWGGAHKISVQKQVLAAAQGLVLIFAKVYFKSSVAGLSISCPFSLNLEP